MRILITGACGMLGRDLVEVLSKKHEVVGLDIRKPSFGLQVTGFIKADITDKNRIIETICSSKPDIVIHTAAYTDVDGCEKNEDLACRVNDIGTQNVALAAKACKAIIAYVSTDFVFNGEKQNPYLENDKTGPLNFYGRSKLAGERHVSLLLDRYFIIRSSWLFGKYGKNFVNTILKLAENKKVLKVVNDQIGSPTYTKDLAQAIKRLINLTHHSSLITHNIFGIYHISNSGSCSWYEFAQEIIHKSHIPGLSPRSGAGTHHTSLKPISSEDLNRPATIPKFSVLNNSRYIKVTAAPLRSWSAALEDYLRQ